MRWVGGAYIYANLYMKSNVSLMFRIWKRGAEWRRLLALHTGGVTGDTSGLGLLGLGIRGENTVP